MQRLNQMLDQYPMSFFVEPESELTIQARPKSVVVR